MRICITAFLGWGNSGDEGILRAIMDSLDSLDSLGIGNEYIVCTNLPHTMIAGYKETLPSRVIEVRQIYDVRNDYDAFILGGGGLSWGYGWRQALNAWSSGKPSMNYGVGFAIHELYLPRLNALYLSFLDQFDAITVRDEYSQGILANLDWALGSRDLETTLTACPSINLTEQACDCPKGMIAVCPRYEDYVGNEKQLDWLVKRLEGVTDEVLLIPFAPFNSEGVPVDLSLCLELQKRLKNSHILHTNGFSPRKVKYAISQSKLVISGGRYHAVLWAIAHGVPYEISPTSWQYPKLTALKEMDAKFGGEKMKEMEKTNVKIFGEKVICLKS